MHNISAKDKVRRAISRLSPYTIKFLNILLPLLLAEFLWFAISFYIEITLDPLRAITVYSPMIEYLMMSLFLTIGSAVIFDIAASERSLK